MISLPLKFQSLELLFTYIHLSLASLSALLKHKSLSFGNFSLLLHEISIFWLEHIYILSKLQRSALNVLALWCKLAFIADIFLKMCSWMYEDSFPILLLCNLMYISLCFIHNSMKSSLKWLIPFRASHVSLNWYSVFWAVR